MLYDFRQLKVIDFSGFQNVFVTFDWNEKQYDKK